MEHGPPATYLNAPNWTGCSLACLRCFLQTLLFGGFNALYDARSFLTETDFGSFNIMLNRSKFTLWRSVFSNINMKHNIFEGGES